MTTSTRNRGASRPRPGTGIVIPNLIILNWVCWWGLVTQPLPLRPDLPPDDAIIVLRAVMSTDNVTRAAERTFAPYAVYGLGRGRDRHDGAGRVPR
ncbi:MAG: hypothetical protein IT198_06745 [Acidimicrobiia bacterium]|nr:hypothetical protein [Acidimicrobiia bacterium]